MCRKLLKTIEDYLGNGGFRREMLDRCMTFAHKAIIALARCNITIFIAYAPALGTYFS